MTNQQPVKFYTDFHIFQPHSAQIRLVANRLQVADLVGNYSNRKKMRKFGPAIARRPANAIVYYSPLISKLVSEAHLLNSDHHVFAHPFRGFFAILALFSLTFLWVAGVCAQETSGALQGTVKDATGAAVANAHVALTSPTLVGTKAYDTDSKGYYHFANLPSGVYTLTATAAGFGTLTRTNLSIAVGSLPTIDLKLSVNSVTENVQVSGEQPQIDVSTMSTQTTISPEVVTYVPHGTSFQSVIQFAPMARNEPLMGSTSMGNGSGATSPGNGSNGGSVGYSIGGAADSENAYLVEGQETADIIGGYSHTNVPFDFVQEVQVKTSGVEAEYRGALGGTVNVIMKKGTNNWHGSAFLQFEASAADGSPTGSLPGGGAARYDPTASSTTALNGATIDPAYQNYQPKKDKVHDILPGFTVGGPLWRNRIFFLGGFNPEFHNVERYIDYSSAATKLFDLPTASNPAGIVPPATGIVPFSQNTQTYYTYARVDATVTQKVRVFASWLYQGQDQAGEALPSADSVNGYYNSATGNNPSIYSHGFGFSAPNVTMNFGGDIAITQSLVSTSRFGYFFANYHDYGYPTGSTIYLFGATGSGATDVDGNALPSVYQQASGYQTAPLDSNFTRRNAEKHVQFDQDFAWYKSGWAGTHSFKAGYQLNRQSSDILQGYNGPLLQILPGAQAYAFSGTTGQDNCAALVAANGAQYGTYDKTTGDLTGCQGKYGTMYAEDAGNFGKATSYNHAFYAQDSWTIGHGLTVSGGVRLEKEYLPAEDQPGGQIVKPINFGWSDKIAPRIGAAWDVFQDGKMKVFGEYGVFNDVMKLNLAISSFGGQYYSDCYYALGDASTTASSPNFTSMTLTPDGSNRYCSGGSSNPANVTGGAPPAGSGISFLENQNYRLFPTTCSTCSLTAEGVAPGLKPYRQHESSFGVDYQLTKTLAFEARYDRRRIDHVIEDSSLINDGNETFVVVNPGQGVDSSFNGFYNFLYGVPPASCSGSGCPPSGVIPPARSYDGVELRLNKAMSHNWYGMFSYTYSSLRGNYDGLTSSDISDGGGGRNAPNNSRSFDEPYFQWNAYGGSSSGKLPTDRPNVFKGYAYYEHKLNEREAIDLGIFQVAYQGSPASSYVDVGGVYNNGNIYGGYSVYPENRGKWVDVSQNATTGVVSVGNAYTKRAPEYTQTDLNLKYTFKLKGVQQVAFDITAVNLLNQHAVVAYVSQIDSEYTGTALRPGGHGLGAGVPAYAAYEQAYPYKALLETPGISINGLYGKPYEYQTARSMRLQIHYNF